jgi:hypothetical protein
MRFLHDFKGGRISLVNRVATQGHSRESRAILSLFLQRFNLGFAGLLSGIVPLL